jgi:hypothetical protein
VEEEEMRLKTSSSLASYGRVLSVVEMHRDSIYTELEASASKISSSNMGNEINSRISLNYDKSELQRKLDDMMAAIG